MRPQPAATTSGTPVRSCKQAAVAIDCFVLIVLTIIYSQLFFRVLLGFGSLDTYYGNNERGNKIMNYAISRIEDKEEEISYDFTDEGERIEINKGAKAT